MLGTDKLLQGRYKITRQLGQGGMGAVYEAEDAKQFGKIVALKEILTSLTNSSDDKQHELFRVAFEREAKILMQVDHEAFPQVIDYFSEGNRQFLVMQLIQGRDLNELLAKRQGAFPLDEVCSWADQLLDALDYLHTLDPPIIHRDIKPQNLKLTSRGKIKLLDFGIAKGVDKKSSVTITNATMVAATLHYSPSEQLLRVIDPITREALQTIYGEKMERVLEQNADLRSDIYSLGATLYHLLTNKPPIDSLKRTIEVWRDKPDNLIPPKKIIPEIPQEISDWIVKSMEIDREKRFSSALEMRNALQTAAAGKSLREEEAKRQSWAIEQEKLRIEREKLQYERQKMEKERLEHQRQVEYERQRRAASESHNSQDAATIVNFQPEHPASQNPPDLGLTQPSLIPPIVPTPPVKPPTDNFSADDQTTHDATALSYFDGLAIEKENTAAHGATEFSYLDGVKSKPENQSAAPAAPPPQKEQKTAAAATSALNGNIKWLIPLAALALLFLGGIAIGMWFMIGSNSGKSEAKDSPANTSTINTDVKSSTIIESSPSPETDSGTINVSETPAQTPDSAPPPAQTKTATDAGPESPSKSKPAETSPPAVQPTKPKPAPTKPKPAPTKKPGGKKDMNCIFTDSCK